MNYKMKPDVSLIKVLQDFYDEHDLFQFNPINKPLVGHVEENSFKLCYVKKGRKNSFAPVYFGNKDKDGNLQIKKRLLVSTMVFMLFISSIFVCWFIIVSQSIISNQNRSGVISLLGGVTVLALMFIVAYMGFIVDQNEVKKIFDGVFIEHVNDSK